MTFYHLERLLSNFNLWFKIVRDKFLSSMECNIWYIFWAKNGRKVTSRSRCLAIEKSSLDARDVDQMKPFCRKQEPDVGDRADGDSHRLLDKVLAVIGGNNLAAEDLCEGVGLEVARHLGEVEKCCNTPRETTVKLCSAETEGNGNTLAKDHSAWVQVNQA